MIVDEIDEPVFNNLQEFYDNTKYVNLHVIGLTATAFHGEKDGVKPELSLPSKSKSTRTNYFSNWRSKYWQAG